MTRPDAIVQGLQLFSRAQDLQAKKDYAKSAALYQQALALLPTHPHVLLGYGRLAEEVGDWAAAEKLYRRLGEVRPDSNFESGLAAALFRQGRYADAIPYFRLLVQRQPSEPDLWHALGNCLGSVGDWEEGLACARRADALRPAAKYLDSALNALHHLGRADELDACIDDALARYPDSPEIRSIYALHKLKSGDFTNGFRFYADLRWRNNLRVNRGQVSAHAGDWDGTPFEGVLVVTAEQGVGDEIMLSSMFDDLLACGQRVMIEADERLLPLYRRTYPTLDFLPKQREKHLSFPAGTDVRTITALDAARVFRSRTDAFPARRAWLRADPARVAALRAGLQARWPGKRLVGLSWRSARTMEGGASKNIAITDLLPLFNVPECVYVNLQYGDIAADLAQLRAAGHDLFVHPEIDPMHDLDGFAALVAALDLVVSTSNTTVHVAGALGVNCWLLLPKTRPLLWYWGYRGDRTPWYPSLALLRNPREDEWHTLVTDVVSRLAALPPPAPAEGKP